MKARLRLLMKTQLKLMPSLLKDKDLDLPIHDSSAKKARILIREPTDDAIANMYGVPVAVLHGPVAGEEEDDDAELVPSSPVSVASSVGGEEAQAIATNTVKAKKTYFDEGEGWPHASKTCPYLCQNMHLLDESTSVSA